MSYIANLTSPYIGNLWTANNVNTISSGLGNVLVVSGNAAPSVINFNFGNIDISGNLNLNGNLKVPVGTTLTRPFGVQGYTRYNTTTSNMEFYNGTSWVSAVNASISITVPNPNGGNGIVLTSTWGPGFSYTFQYIAVGNQYTNFFYGTSSTNVQTLPVPNNTYLITTTGNVTASFILNGAGGGGGANLSGSYTGAPGIGGNGGQTTGTYTLVSGTTYYLVVGGGGAFIKDNYSPIPLVGAGGGGNVGSLGYGGQGGGYTGLFINSVSQANAIMIAGGGGGASWETNPSTPSGGAGGGSSGNAGAPGTLAGGGGGTQIAGGSGPSSNPGSALQGGASAGSDPHGGGGGGGGYFGGGGGSGDGNGSGGGGGSGYFNSSVVTGGSTTTGAGATGGAGGTVNQQIIVYGGNGSATMTYVG
jgi:hypothetical protein